VQAGADDENSAGNAQSEGADERTIGAEESGRGKLVTVPAVRIAEIVELLDRCDLEAARRAIASILVSPPQ
jgi:hypothetical protein